MLGFPPPYPAELLYSTLARAGVHDGEISPKQLLDKVFNDRGVIATVDLPSHLGKLANQYPASLLLDTQTLISRHTLWPIYASFLPQERNNKLRMWMCGSSKGAAHLASGIVASRVKAKNKFYICVECLKEQKSAYGEYFWNRLWQVPLLKVCPIHGSLHTTNIEFDGEHRHSYIPVEAAKILDPVSTNTADKIFAHQVSQLLELNFNGVNFFQWTVFYKQLASKLGYLSGKRIDHARIHDTVIHYWGKTWLSEQGILPTCEETSWLRGLFRKHRKSFSFAEHIVAISALSNGELVISNAIKTASSITVSIKPQAFVKNHKVITKKQLTQDQIDWQQLLEKSSPKMARSKNPALYARLYRNHHDWLIYYDSRYCQVRARVNKRVDWSQRDRQLARRLLRVCEHLSEDLNAPHLSRTFLIHQIEQSATVEKNLYRLPRCSTLLARYSEKISDYQARRITRAYLSMLKKDQEIKRWSLLREAGLSDERMTSIVRELLKEILNEHSKGKI